MTRKIVFGALAVMLLSTLPGCATSRQSRKDVEMQQLRVRVDELETQLQEKEDQIYKLEDKLTEAKETKAVQKVSAGKPEMSNCTPKNIQTALKNANLYKGPIDGKVGKETKGAIKEFQKVNGLEDDGIVGKKTWALLQTYL